VLVLLAIQIPSGGRAFHHLARGDHGLQAVEEPGGIVAVIHVVLASSLCINFAFGIGLNGSSVPEMSINEKYPVDRRPLMKHVMP
jgi:hypothetical protein